SLTQLYLNTNNFYGAIRSELALLTSLQKLRLDFNDLTTYENGSLSIPTLTEIRLQNNNLAQVVCNGIIREIANYGSRAASGSLNLDNNNRPEQDIIDNEVTTLTGASWTVTYETVEDVQRYVSFETGDLTEAEYDHGDVMFLSQVGASSASYQVIDTDAYQGTYSLEMSISDTEVDQAGSRYIQRWYDNLGSGEKIKDGDFLSLAMKLPAEPVLDSGLSDEFVQVTQIKYQHTDGSDAMFSMNVGRPSQSPNPSILQFYLNIKRPNGLKQVQVYQNSPVELPINQWFIVQYRIKQSTINGNYVNPDGVMEIWSGLPDSISKIFELTNIYTISDVDPTGRLQFGAGNAYGKGILSPNPFKVLIDEIRISKLYKHLVSDPGAIPSLNPNLFQIITQKQGTFSPTVTIFSSTATWTIDEDDYTTNSPSVLLDENTIGTTNVDARILFPNITQVAAIDLSNQDIIYMSNIDNIVNLDTLDISNNSSLEKDISDFNSLSVLANLYANNCNLYGDISLLDGFASNIFQFNIYNNSNITYGNGGSFALYNEIDLINISNCLLSETEVNTIINDIYSNKSNQISGAKTLNIDGNNGEI
ncbi:MAG: hypothetical protein KC414_08295, partial [Romboutsia sp.]|nr:hypothetical protein [Romboutsia sp.]